MNRPYPFRILSLVLVMSSLVTAAAVHADEKTALNLLRRDLAQATTAYEKAIRRCTPEKAFSDEAIRKLQKLGLTRTRLIRTLGWLALERRATCERPERQALAEAVVRLRTALVAGGKDPGNVDRLAETLWGDALRMAGLRAEYASLPSALRRQFEGMAALQRPFDLATVLDALAVPADTATAGSPVE